MYFENWHMHWLESSFPLAWEQQSIPWHLHTMPRPIKLEWVLMEKYIRSLSLRLPKGSTCFSKPMFVYSCQQMPTSTGTIKWLQKTLEHDVNNHHPWQEAARLHIHFPVFGAETSVYSHKALVDASSCRPLGLIYLNTRLLQMFAAAESLFRNSWPPFN